MSKTPTTIDLDYVYPKQESNGFTFNWEDNKLSVPSSLNMEYSYCFRFTKVNGECFHLNFYCNNGRVGFSISASAKSAFGPMITVNPVKTVIPKNKNIKPYSQFGGHYGSKRK